MILDVTLLDKNLLLRTLYDSATPKGIGITEFNTRKANNELVHDIDNEECNKMLSSFNELYKQKDLLFDKDDLDENEDPEKYGPGAEVADYVNGIPVKLNLYIPYSDISKVYSYSNSFDMRNGLYLFLETLINTFPLDDFRLIDIEYPEHWDLNEINNENNFKKSRYDNLKIVVDNLLPNGYINRDVLKSLDYFNNLII